ncbi:hypothetical protein PSR62_17440 [Rhodopirellula sp. P2]|nr:hypothetical protein [Rhodopirellula sp. P2]WDQ15416.1 hypothetical protein PSR62_17440 [Rhodopirellula sp. P2]
MHLRRAVEQAGIWKHVTSHTFRHCFATHLLWQSTGNRSRDAARRRWLGTQTLEDKCSPLVSGLTQRSCSFTSPSLREGRPASGRGGFRAGFNAEPSPRFARPSQGEGDEKRVTVQHLKTAQPPRWRAGLVVGRCCVGKSLERQGAE